MRQIWAAVAMLMLAGLALGQEEKAITVEDTPPVVVKTIPQAGDVEVDPGLKEIRVTFSKDMKTEKMWAWCRLSPETFPAGAGDVYYLADKRTCVKPVTLEPGKTYAMWLNLGRFNSFRDTDDHPAVPYLLVFKTKEKAGK